MLSNYVKQAWHTFRETPLVSLISLLGTALSIAMIMVVVLLFQIKLAGYSPESKRARMLYVNTTSAVQITGHEQNNGGMSIRVAKECYYPLATAEAVAVFSREIRPVWLPARRLFDEHTVKYVDPGFWKVFDFTFVAGHPFTEADFRSAIPKVVITDRLAASFFGSEEVVGKSIVIDYIEYAVTGVVKSVSRAATDAFAEVWVPYTTRQSLSESCCEGIGGGLRAVLLAPSVSAKKEVCRELDGQIRRFNQGQKEFKLELLFGQPLSRLDVAIGNNGFKGGISLRDYLFHTGGLLLFLLLIPALNLVSVVQSAVQKRSGELGLRRAFGASRKKLVGLVLSENMVVTLMGSMLGLLLSVLLLYLGKRFLLYGEVELQASMLFQPAFFLSALGFAVVLNLLSAWLPAWRISRKQIVTSLGEEK